MIAKLLLFLISFVLASPPFLAAFNEKIVSGDIKSLQRIIDINSEYIKSSKGKHYFNEGLVLAARKRHTPVVELLLKNANVDAAENNNAAIRIASAFGDHEIVKLLLERPEVNPGAMDNEALLVAAQEGHTDVVRLLLAHPKVNPIISGRRAIFLASERNHVDIVKLFINDGRANPTIFQIYTLKKAAQVGNVDLVQFLLGYPFFNKLAHLVITEGDLTSIQTLVEAGYKIDEEILDRSIQYARARGDDDIIKYLESLKTPKLPIRPSILMNDQCAICLADKNLLEGYMTTCHHQFHAVCLQKWISKHNSCPICRTSII